MSETERLALRRLEEELMPLLRKAQAEAPKPKHYARWSQLLCLLVGHYWFPDDRLSFGNRMSLLACKRCGTLR